MAFLVCLSAAVSGQWQPLGGPAGRYVRTFATDSQYVFAATGGGVLRSHDAGQSWVFCNQGLMSRDTKSLALNDSLLFVSTDENVFRSADRGNTWQAAGTALQGKYVKTILLANGVLFAGTYCHGIYRSFDMGNTWEPASTGIAARYIYWLDSDGTNIFAATYLNGFYRSTDLGDTWTACNNGISENTIMTVHSFGGKTFSSTLGSVVYVTSNGGDSWANVGTSLPAIKGFASANSVLYAGSFGSGVYKSLDTGQSWTQMNTGLSESDLWAIGANDSAVFTGVSSGHVYTRDQSASSWSVTFNSSFLSCVGAFAESGSNLIVATHGSGLYTKSNFGTTWIKCSTIGTVEIRSLLAGNGFVLAGTDMLGMFKSTDDGNSFTAANTGLGSSWIQCMAICGTKVFAGTGESGVYVSANSGTSWSLVSGLPAIGINAIASNGTIVVVAAIDSTLYISTNGGTSWSQLSSWNAADQIISLALCNNSVFAGTRSSGLFSSNDQGASWNPVTAYVPFNPEIRCLFSYYNLVFAGTAAGELVYSQDYGSTWTVFYDIINDAPITALYTGNTGFYAGTNGGGVWQVPINQLVIGINTFSETEPLVFPNPADQFIEIEFPVSGTVRYSVFDVHGAVVISGFLQSGMGKIYSTQLPEGVYLIQISNRGNSICKKIQIVH